MIVFALTYTRAPNITSLALSAVVAGPCFAFLLASPYLLKDLFYGKFWSTQARFYGIEGYYEIAKFEEQLFGINHGRLRWPSNATMHSDAILVDDGLNSEGKNPHLLERLPKRDAEGRSCSHWSTPT